MVARRRANRVEWVAHSQPLLPVIALIVAFAAGVAIGECIPACSRGARRPIAPAGAARVGPPPLSQSQANERSLSGLRPGATFSAYITGPVDPLVAARRGCEDATAQAPCDEPTRRHPLPQATERGQRDDAAASA